MGALIREGWRFVVRHPVMRPCMFGATADNFANGALMALIPVFLVRDLHASPALVGVLIAADGVGACIGAALAPWLTARLGSARAILVAAIGGAAVALLMPVGARGVGAWWRSPWPTSGSASAWWCSASRADAPAGGEPAGAAVAGDRDRAVRVVGRDPVRRAAGRRGRDGGRPRGALWVACLLTLLGPALLWFSPVRRLRDLAEEPAPPASSAPAGSSSR